MKLTIIVSDNAVYQDGRPFFDLDLSFIPSDVHALQWNEVKGWIEFCSDKDNQKKSNEDINELPDWAISAIEKWSDAKSAEDAAISLAASQEQNSLPIQST